MKTLQGIKGVFLDLGGTLLYPPSGSWTFSGLAYRYFPKEKLQTPAALAAMREAQKELDRNHLLNSLEAEYEQFYRYYQSVAQALDLGLRPDILREITEDKVHNKRDNYRLFDDTIPTLKALHGQYRLGIISDTWPSIVPLLEYLNILSCFDCVTYSFRLGVFKPDPKMYQDALSKMGLPAQETLFVDDLPKNLEGARAQGIQPVLVMTQPDAKPREDMPCIQTISGLLPLLGLPLPPAG